MRAVTEGRRDTKSALWSRLCGFFFRSKLLRPLVSTRTGRRSVVVGNGLTLLGFTLGAWLTGSAGAVAALVAPYLVFTLAIAVATGGVLDKPIRYLDERQRQARRSLFGDPYATGAALGLAGGLLIAFSLQAEDALALGVFMSVFGAVFGLPSMVYAWSIPDVDDEDE